MEAQNEQQKREMRTKNRTRYAAGCFILILFFPFYFALETISVKNAIENVSEGVVYLRSIDDE